MQVKPDNRNAPEIAQVKGETPVIDNVKQDGNLEMSGISDRDPQLLKLIQDIREGNCRTTARAVRKHLSCNMNRAAELTRLVKGEMH